MSNPAPQPLTLAQRLSFTLHALREAAAARAVRTWSLAPTVLLLWSYLNRLAVRFAALAVRQAAGRIPPPRARKPADRARSAPKPRLPQGFGWLLRRVPEAIHYRSQLHHLLADPDMAALLAASPQAGRLLRPLCRMLGIGPDPDLPPALFRPKAARQPPVPPMAPAPPGIDPRLEDRPALGGSPVPA